MADIVLSEVDERGIATVTLNRPEVHNAYDGALIDGLIAAIGALGADPRVRVLVLRANGKHIQAGADLAWLKRMAGFDFGTSVSGRPVAAEIADAAPVTAQLLCMALGLALIVGVPLGILAGCFPIFRAFLAPVTVFGRNVLLGTVTTWLYLLLGWMPMVAAWPIIQRIPGGLLAWMVAGELLYTFGVGFLQIDRKVRYAHAVWHILVIAGSAFAAGSWRAKASGSAP